MSIQVIDNFLPHDQFMRIFNAFLGPSDERSIPWMIGDKNTLGTKELNIANSYQDTNDLYNYQFNHLFFRNIPPQVSDRFSVLIPIIDRLQPTAIKRIKANLTPATPSIITYDMHCDYHNFGGKTAVFYMNTNNGYTLIENGDRVESVANRICIMGGKVRHAATSCTDKRFRCVLNFNYYVSEDENAQLV